MEKAIPSFLIQKITEQYNENEAKIILEGLTKTRKSTFRVNRINSDENEISEVLMNNKINFERATSFDDAFIISKESENIVRNLDVYKKGKIYFQTLSSMMPIIILDPKGKENILDMCAAPRWKN